MIYKTDQTKTQLLRFKEEGQQIYQAKYKNSGSIRVLKSKFHKFQIPINQGLKNAEILLCILIKKNS